MGDSYQICGWSITTSTSQGYLKTGKVTIQFFNGTTANKVDNITSKHFPTSFNSTHISLSGVIISPMSGTSNYYHGALLTRNITASTYQLHYMSSGSASYSVDYKALAVGY